MPALHEIVEIVGDTTGKLHHRLHLLRLEKLPLQGGPLVSAFLRSEISRNSAATCPATLKAKTSETPEMREIFVGDLLGFPALAVSGRPGDTGRHPRCPGAAERPLRWSSPDHRRGAGLPGFARPTCSYRSTPDGRRRHSWWSDGSPSESVEDVLKSDDLLAETRPPPPIAR